MPTLYRASFAYLWRHPWQLVLALLGICIGVAVIVAVDLANDSSRRDTTLSVVGGEIARITGSGFSSRKLLID